MIERTESTYCVEKPRFSDRSQLSRPRRRLEKYWLGDRLATALALLVSFVGRPKTPSVHIEGSAASNPTLSTHSSPVPVRTGCANNGRRRHSYLIPFHARAQMLPFETDVSRTFGDLAPARTPLSTGDKRRCLRCQCSLNRRASTNRENAGEANGGRQSLSTRATRLHGLITRRADCRRRQTGLRPVSAPDRRPSRGIHGRYPFL
jgi:hypothetical protein